MVSKREQSRRISKGLRKSIQMKELAEINSCVKDGMSVFEIAVKCGFTVQRVKTLLRTLANINHLHNAGEIVGGIVGGIGGTIAGAELGGPAGAALGSELGQAIGSEVGKAIEQATKPRAKKKA